MADIIIDREQPTPPHITPQWTWQFRLKVIVAAVAMLVLGAAVGIAVDRSVINPPQQEQLVPAGAAKYEPRNVEEERFFRSLRTPTYSEGIAMGRASSEAGLPVAWVSFVATEDLVLPSAPLSQDVTIGLPPGIKWQSGALNNIRLVVAEADIASLPLALRDGKVLYDRWCAPSLTDGLIQSECPHVSPPGITEEKMLGTLRLLAREEFEAYPGLLHVNDVVPTREGNVFLATGDVVLSPYLGNPDEVPVIVLDKNARVTGGHFGKIQVVARGQGNGRNVQYEVLHDPVYTLTLPSDNAAVETGNQSKLICGIMSQQVRQTIYAGACLA